MGSEKGRELKMRERGCAALWGRKTSVASATLVHSGDPASQVLCVVGNGRSSWVRAELWEWAQMVESARSCTQLLQGMTQSLAHSTGMSSAETGGEKRRLRAQPGLHSKEHTCEHS